jgi:nitroimidazol reductase NimA-like FMN-containing flavoprotein (pyridoxamine 5'-phosphate oxidase superfamily)
MSQDILTPEIEKFVSKAGLGILAYTRADHTPVQRTFGAFAVIDNDIVFTTQKSSAKVPEIVQRPRVSFFIEKTDQQFGEWKSALFLGDAVELQDASEIAQAIERISARSPFIRERVAKGELKGFALFRLRTQAIEWLDYGKGLGHVDKISLVRQ